MELKLNNEIRSQCDRLIDLIPKEKQKQRKRYNRLTESLIRRYFTSHLRDIKLGGTNEALRMIDRRIFNKNSDVPREIVELTVKNRNKYANFLYKIAANYDIDALVGFFVPFIYGGMVSKKNMSGEAIRAFEFDQNEREVDQNARYLSMIHKIEEARRGGIGIFLIVGDAGDIYSPRMLRTYQSSKNECFIIVERGGEGELDEKSSRNGSYRREVLSDLAASKNIFIVLGGGDMDISEIHARSRALSSYNLLHGITLRDREEKAVIEAGKGSELMVFDHSLRIGDIMQNKSAVCDNFTEFMEILPQNLRNFISDPTFPLHLPDIFTLLVTMQYIASDRKFDRIVVENL